MVSAQRESPADGRLPRVVASSLEVYVVADDLDSPGRRSYHEEEGGYNAEDLVPLELRDRGGRRAQRRVRRVVRGGGRAMSWRHCPYWGGLYDVETPLTSVRRGECDVPHDLLGREEEEEEEEDLAGKTVSCGSCDSLNTLPADVEPEQKSRRNPVTEDGGERRVPTSSRYLGTSSRLSLSSSGTSSGAQF